MKRYCKNLYASRELVEEAYLEWLDGAAGKKNGWRVAEEHGSASALIDEIYEEWRDRRLTFRPIHRYTTIDPGNGKERLIGVESVKQQVCDYLAVHCLEPLLKARVGYWQVSSVKGKGQVFAMTAAKKQMRLHPYFVHADIRKCYGSTGHATVMGVYRRYVASEDVLYLIETLLGTYTEGGLEIGSYFSLRTMQLVLSDVYHFAEGLRKERRGRGVRLVGFQVWYMDDIYLFGDSKRDLKMAVRAIAGRLSLLGLSLKPWKVCRSSCEPAYVTGYTVRSGRATVGPRIYVKASRAFRRYDRRRNLRLARRVGAYWGWISKASTRRVTRARGYARIQREAALAVSMRERMAA